MPWDSFMPPPPTRSDWGLKAEFLELYETALNHSSGQFRPSDMAFCPVVAFLGQWYDPTWVRHTHIANISFIIGIRALEFIGS